MISNKPLPATWCEAALPEVAQVNPANPTSTPNDETLVSFVPMASVEVLSGRLNPKNHRPWREVKKGYTRFQDGDVLVAKITPCMENGKAALARGLSSGVGAGSTEFHVLRPNMAVLPETLLYYVLQQEFRKDARAEMTGTAGQLRVPSRFLEEQTIPLPPLSEQSRIVEAIESYFTRLDDAATTLERVQRNLKRYRASVLKAAVEGQLVPTEAELARAEGRDYEPASVLIAQVKRPMRPARFGSRSKNVIIGHSALAVGNPGTELPEGWVWAQLVDVARLETGHTPSRSHPEWWGGKVPWIGIKDARAHHGGTIYGTLQHTNEDGLANSAARLLPAGTVCLSRTASVGYVVVMGKPMATSQDFVNWVCTEALDPQWLRYVLLTDRESLLRFGKGTTHTTIYFPEVISLHIALPPIAEQKRIVTELDRVLSHADACGDVVATNDERCAHVRQSILKWAFEGRLADQDTTDEPAAQLLERIRFERGSTSGNARRTRSRGRSTTA